MAIANKCSNASPTRGRQAFGESNEVAKRLRECGATKWQMMFFLSSVFPPLKIRDCMIIDKKTDCLALTT
jgi:hypothetical protein